ncbi:MAG: aminoacetone oxidase family FAD-binding enzyme [Atopobium sp.]|uniref:aminoacetone oxidase family FAD-binding enzyme n=1 Tax=Atopobium sp. TaxID=1872650 RepID=UPI002A75AD47|nr:aminoacetone oxidase family FAD-binding enzyme [Atopobium sp.]MDY2787783.1 aminoacetone oxidase family FAD-binding enzyme [Atopobium sp.]
MATSKASIRKKQRAQAIAAARALNLLPSYDVVVLGGGAAGLVAAITAAEAGATTLIIEKDYECGRTILATGNGRCNFTNLYLEAKHFNNPHFVEPVLGATPLKDILDFFRESGLMWTQKEGRLYPRSLSAASVRSVLLHRAQRAGVVVACCKEAQIASYDVARGLYQVTIQESVPENESLQHIHVHAQKLIVAIGSTTSNALRSFNLPQVALRPGLCALSCEPSPLNQLDGKRSQASLALFKGMFPHMIERGEVLFRSYGLSGIAVFNLSRVAEPGDTIEIDLVPEHSESEINQRIFELGADAITYDGILDPTIAQVVLDMAHIAHEQNLAHFIKHIPLVVTGLADTAHAQVTRGGFACTAFNPTTLEAHTQNGLYCVGEALDVDGACGGFNLSWAWKSGMVAGAHAAATCK